MAICNNNDDSSDIIQKDIATLRKCDTIVLKEHIVEVIEITHASIGSKPVMNFIYHFFSSNIHFLFIKCFVVGKDIFTNRRYEDVIPRGHMVRIPRLDRKDYLLISIDDDGYTILLNEETCDTRNDLKLTKNSDLCRQLLEKYNEGNQEIKVTILKALGEEHIIEFKLLLED